MSENAYVYQEALYCEKCGDELKEDLAKNAGKSVEKMEEELGTEYDSDEFPDGPYPDGGGEADSPQHCDFCNLFLENPLTPDGMEYVKEAVDEAVASGDMESVAVTEWAPFYDIDVAEGDDEDDENSDEEVDAMVTKKAEEGVPAGWPTAKEIAEELLDGNTTSIAEEDGPIDVRLQVTADGDWEVHYGLADYDTDHSGFWGSGSIPGNGEDFDAEDVATDLLEQALEDFAMSKEASTKKARLATANRLIAIAKALLAEAPAKDKQKAKPVSVKVKNCNGTKCGKCPSCKLVAKK